MNKIQLTIVFWQIFANSKWIRQYLWVVIWTLRWKILATDITSHLLLSILYNRVAKIRHLRMQEGNRQTYLWKILPINVPVWVLASCAWTLRLRQTFSMKFEMKWNTRIPSVSSNSHLTADIVTSKYCYFKSKFGSDNRSAMPS